MQDESRIADDQLLAAVSRGDESAAGLLYARYADLVYRIGYRVLLDDWLAKDSAQEAWIKVFRNAHRFLPGTSARSWIATIAVRCAIDGCRKHRQVHAVRLDDEAGSSWPSALPSARDEVEEKEIHEAIQEVLSRLTVQQRAAFVLRHYEDTPLRDIALALNCSEGTVKSHLYRAVAAVRRALADYLAYQEQEP
ncbi:MAG: RNA polymerase sigma factor [bacterium]